MKAELRERILAYNRAMAQRKEKAEDMDVIATALLALLSEGAELSPPPEQALKDSRHTRASMAANSWTNFFFIIGHAAFPRKLPGLPRPGLLSV